MIGFLGFGPLELLILVMLGLLCLGVVGAVVAVVVWTGRGKSDDPPRTPQREFPPD